MGYHDSYMEHIETKEQKRLYRSRTNRVFAGICGGLGEYLEIEPVVLRLMWLLITVFTGIFPGLLAYFVAIFIVPEKM